MKKRIVKNLNTGCYVESEVMTPVQRFTFTHAQESALVVTPARSKDIVKQLRSKFNKQWFFVVLTVEDSK